MLVQASPPGLNQPGSPDPWSSLAAKAALTEPSRASAHSVEKEPKRSVTLIWNGTFLSFCRLPVDVGLLHFDLQVIACKCCYRFLGAVGPPRPEDLSECCRRVCWAALKAGNRLEQADLECAAPQCAPLRCTLGSPTARRERSHSYQHRKQYYVSTGLGSIICRLLRAVIRILLR